MYIRKFYGNGMKAVLKQAKDELGEDVVILSQKNVEGGRVELTAAIDPPKEHQRWERDALEEEIADIKRMLLSLLEEKEIAQLGKPALLLYRELKHKGMSEAVAYQVLKDLAKGISPEDLMNNDVLRQGLRKFFFSRIQTVAPLTNEKMCIALLGRTGVGKTTTIAKLAAMERLLRKRRVAVISLDAFKVGSREELERIGKLLDIPVGIVYERGQLEAEFERFSKVDTIFIDTPGKGVNEKGVKESIFDIMTIRPHTQFHLLLSPHYQREVLVQDLEEYGRLSLKSLIVTKLDESRCIGGFMDAILSRPIPLYWMTTGQDIPRDIHEANKGLLFDRMMEAEIGKGAERCL